ncbi:MAG: peptidylprolyl isomerase, partial [Deltaproteobacteria bacterium]
MAKSKSRIKSMSDTFVWIILILVFVGLGGYGALNFSRGVTSVGEVGTTSISFTRYLAELNSEVAALGRQFNQAIPISMARQFGVDKQVLQNLIGEVAGENEAKTLGISAGDVSVATAVQADPSFAGLSGKFDIAAYRDELTRRGYSVTDYENQIRAGLARGILQSAIVGGVKMPSIFAETAYNYAGERRTYTWAKVTPAQLETPVPAPTDAEIQAWYDAHPADFTAPEIKKIDFVALKPEDVAKSMTVDDEQLKAFYQERIADYVVPERRLVERLIFTSRDAADAAMAEIVAGTKTFDDYVTARGLTLDDVDLGEQSKEQLGAAGDAVFALTEPGI